MLPLLGTAIAAVACALCLLCALLTFGATLWSMNTVNMRPEHPWGQGAYGAGPRLREATHPSVQKALASLTLGVGEELSLIHI